MQRRWPDASPRVGAARVRLDVLDEGLADLCVAPPRVHRPVARGAPEGYFIAKPRGLFKADGNPAAFALGLADKFGDSHGGNMPRRCESSSRRYPAGINLRRKRAKA